MSGKQRSWMRGIAYLSTLGALVFAGAAATQAAAAPDQVSATRAAADTGTCSGSGSAQVQDPHPGLHKGFSTTQVFEGSGATTSCTSNTAIAKVSGAGTSTLTGTCIDATGTASASRVKSFDAAGNVLGQSSGTANVVLVATDNDGVKITVSSGSITSGFQSGAIFAGVGLSAPGVNTDCLLNNGTLSSGSGDGNGSASR